MKKWESALIGPDVNLLKALEIIDSIGTRLALVVDKNRRLLGTVSDGDVRRALLAGVGMSDLVQQVMQTSPTTALDTSTPREILTQMRRTSLHQIPIVNANREVVGLALINDYLMASRRDNWVVIMAGGPGTRLKELTLNTPKPMLRVGTRPLLETIIRSYAEQGFQYFHLAVNYKAEQIEAHFGDGSAYGVEIRYVREKQRLGTAGALSLLLERPIHPFIVTNADLLTKEDYGLLIDRHIESGAAATMAVRHYEMQIPFGVVKLTNSGIEKIEEKPMQHFLVNAGVYALSPEALNLVPKGRFFDMPELFAAIIQANLPTRAHLIENYWLDIGQISDFDRANIDFYENFT